MANDSLKDASPRSRCSPLPEKMPFCGQRKRVTVPVTPFNSLLATGAAYCGTNCELEEVGTLNIVGINFAANADTAFAHWFIPDDMDISQSLWIRMLYITNTKGTTDSVVMTVEFKANVIKDHSAAAVGTIIGNTTASLTGTALVDTIDCVDLTQYAVYRGMKGVIAADTFEQDGICTLDIVSTTVETSSVLDVVGVEFWYVQRKV